jgi:hypothetical protein
MVVAVASVGLRAAATIFALTWLVLPGFGLIDLLVTWNADWPVVLAAGWGLLFSLLVGAAFLAIAVSPRQASAAIAQLVVVAAALALSAVLRMYRENRQGADTDITLGINHYAVQAALALALVMLSGSAAVWPHLRELSGTLSGLVGIYVGTVSFFWQGTLGGYDKGGPRSLWPGPRASPRCRSLLAQVPNVTG